MRIAWGRFGVAGTLACALAGGVYVAESGARPRALAPETIDQPPAKVLPKNDPQARSVAAPVTTGPYVSIQINVDAAGHNIVGDAANEPSIAINPLNPANMVVVWRQFDAIGSNFRQGGWAYTFDGGQTWTFPGVLTPGTFRSDPVVDVDSTGNFYWASLKSDDSLDVFKSTDGGVTWGDPTPAFGGDKNWMVVDRTGGATNGTVYATWQHYVSCCGTNMLTRSLDGAVSFNAPVPVPPYSPELGTMDVDADGALYMVGIDGSGSSPNFFQFIMGKPNFNPPELSGAPLAPPPPTPPPISYPINLGGYMGGGQPNPGGLIGQPSVAADRSSGPYRGNVYVLASVALSSGNDPEDVHFIRSEDGGRTFSAPVRVNDDTGTDWQWFAVMSVAPNSRIDAVWIDSRGTSAPNLGRLYYSYSWDAGRTWARNVPVSPLFDSNVGWPQQSKIGDYMGMVSDASGANVAYSATYLSEENLYYLHVFPDCNNNGISDVTDIASHTSFDCNLDHIPDECGTAPVCIGAGGVPDGGAGVPLTLAKGAGDAITLSWGSSCVTADADYAVYEGALGEFTSHAPRACSTGGALTYGLVPPAGDTYYLVVPVHADREGSYGTDGTGAERPPSTTACLPQAIHACGS
jgi:hypothetical protein